MSRSGLNGIAPQPCIPVNSTWFWRDMEELIMLYPQDIEAKVMLAVGLFGTLKISATSWL
jgi:hypothetical protein